MNSPHLCYVKCIRAKRRICVLISEIKGLRLMATFVWLQMFKLKGANDEMSEQMEQLKREKKSLEGLYLKYL